MLSDAQIERYSRQLILPEIGPDGQEKLLRAKVALVMRRAPYDPALLYLAAAGIGRLAVIEVDEHGQPPARRDVCLHPSNPDSVVERHTVSAPAIADLLVGCAAVLAATDDRLLLGRLNRTCVAQAIPLLVASTQGATGSVVTLAGHRRDAPCYACAAEGLAGAAPAAAVAAAPAANLIAALQASEAIKLVVGVGRVRFGELLNCDTARMSFSYSALAKDPRCSTCAAAEAGA